MTIEVKSYFALFLVCFVVCSPKLTKAYCISIRFPSILWTALILYVDEDFDNQNEDGGGWSDLDNSDEEDSDLENSMNEEDDADDDSDDDEIALQAELVKIR
jgi:hypothetical protein